MMLSFRMSLAQPALIKRAQALARATPVWVLPVQTRAGVQEIAITVRKQNHKIRAALVGASLLKITTAPASA